MSFVAAFFASTGVIIFTALSSMSSAVSISSSASGSTSGSESSESDSIVADARVVRVTFFWDTKSTFSYCRNLVHFAGPSMSSTFFSLFLVLSK
jgi:hypothetical protein